MNTTTTTTAPRRAVFVGHICLTGKEYAHLDDDALLAEAWAEAERGGLTRYTGEDEHLNVRREDLAIVVLDDDYAFFC